MAIIKKISWEGSTYDIAPEYLSKGGYSASLPSLTAADEIIVSKLAQTIAGAKTFSSSVDISNASASLQIYKLYARTSSSSTTYGVGTTGQVLKSNGTNAYWGSDSSDNTTQAIGANYLWQNQMAGYQIFITNHQDKLVPMVTGASGTASTGTGKTMNTEEYFNPFGLIGYTGSSSYRAANAACSGSTYIAYSSVDIRYSFNCGSTLTTNAPVYIVAKMYDAALAKLTSPYYSQNLPSTDDGKIYIYLGEAISSTSINLQQSHPIYCFKNNSLRVWNADADNGWQVDTSRPMTSGYVTIFDDEIDEDGLRPDNYVDFSDPDAYIYSTGIAVLDADEGDFYQYSFPAHSGILATADQLGLELIDLRNAT